MIEQEYKWMADREMFLHILQCFSSQYEEQLILQKNYFYDSPDLFLYRKGITLRVREKDGSFSLQTKIGKRMQDGYRVAEEQHVELTALPEQLTGEKLGLSPELRFAMLGCLATKRHRFQLAQAVRLDCDESTYLDVTDYEVELEFTGAAPAALSTLFQGLTPSPLSKHQRFLKQMGRIE